MKKNVMKRKCFFSVCTIMMVLTMFGCTKSENAESTESGQTATEADETVDMTQSETADSGQNEKGTLTVDDVMNAPVTDEQYFTYREKEEGIVALSCTCEDDIIVLPETIDGKTVVGIEPNLFTYNTTGAKGIYVADTVEVIPEVAFVDCSDLEILVLGKGVKVIEHGSITVNENLRVISVLSEQLETLEDHSIVACSALEEIYFKGDCKEVMHMFGATTPTIYGPADSNIEKYANENGLTYVVW